MARVVLTGNLAKFADGEAELELNVASVRQLLKELGERHPRLKPHLEKGLAVAIDGTIYQEAWLEAIPPNGEVFLMPQIGGG